MLYLENYPSQDNRKEAVRMLRSIQWQSNRFSNEPLPAEPTFGLGGTKIHTESQVDHYCGSEVTRSISQTAKPGIYVVSGVMTNKQPLTHEHQLVYPIQHDDVDDAIGACSPAA